MALKMINKEEQETFSALNEYYMRVVAKHTQIMQTYVTLIEKSGWESMDYKKLDTMTSSDMAMKGSEITRKKLLRMRTPTGGSVTAAGEHISKLAMKHLDNAVDMEQVMLLNRGRMMGNTLLYHIHKGALDLIQKEMNK